MAFRAMGLLLGRLGGNRPFATSTTPEMKPFASAMDSVHSDHPRPKTRGVKAEFAPVYVMLGMVLVAVAIGVHTAKQQLVHSPTVLVKKKKRESFPEVEEPDAVVDSADELLKKSFLRKVAHIQQIDRNLPDPIRGDPFIRPRKAETLKRVGVEPSHH
ncbi:uncharacterized protein LOC131160324 [Malania oleifera]|uniref:uncharacterized protein LOC131160324 n=1 Tax=Malania oleifera TaxID=397392 RepID=UPI0025AE78F4|nr:uncharacterized protein LOC131160324 [Malania oleifera]